MKKNCWNIHERIFLMLIILVLVLISLNVVKAKGWLFPEQPPIKIESNIIKLSSLTLEQKIGQMIIVHGASYNQEAWKRVPLGGIHLFALKDPELFKQIIQNYQQDITIPFFVSVDLEGCLNPFANFQNFTPAIEIRTIDQAFKKGQEEGKFLKELGFNLNYAPVVDLGDEIWHCRNFPGDEKQITKLAQAYLEGLKSEGIIGTIKHYPGKTLVVQDPHKYLVLAHISAADVFPYETLKSEAELIMVSHIITNGEIDSKGQPSVVSPLIIAQLQQNYSGLIISDEINMLGLRQFYNSTDEMYLALFKAGNDLILNFNDSPEEIYHMIEVIKEGVERGEISEARIDNSVRKILELKGFRVQ